MSGVIMHAILIILLESMFRKKLHKKYLLVIESHIVNGIVFHE